MRSCVQLLWLSPFCSEDSSPTVAWSQEGSGTSNPGNWAQGLFGNQTSFNFGVVARGAKVEHRFAFSNPYVETVHVASVESSCHCTEPTAPKPEVKTYEQSEIVATIDTRHFTGQREATLTVHFDQPFPATAQLHVYAYIRSDVVVQPGEARFESIAQGTPATQKLTVTYAGRPDWKIVEVKTANPNLDAKVIERRIGRRR